MIDPAPSRVAVPRPAVPWTAPPEWRCIEFISDLHLDAATPRTADRLVRYLQRTEADAVCVLGDLFEVWIGTEVLDTPGPEADLAHALRSFSQRRTLALMVGNRDFLVNELALQRLGMHALADPTVLVAWGERTLLTHGDAWCLDDMDYQRFRAEVRQPAWQTTFLARPYAERQAIARQLRAGSEARKHALGPEAYGDIDTTEARRQLQAAHSQRLIHGHTHKPSDDVWPDAAPASSDIARHVLSDWDCDHAASPRAQVLRLTQDGVQRCAVDADGGTVIVDHGVNDDAGPTASER